MVFNVLSQDVLSTDIARRLRDERFIGIVGLPGSGKTFTCSKLSKTWQANEGAALIAPGDAYQKARRFFPFQHAISQSSVTKQVLLKSATGAVAKGATAIPFAGPFAGFVIERLFAHSMEKTKERSQILNAEEQNILYHLQGIYAKRPMLIVCDDLQFWDDSSIALLRILLSGKLSNVYPFLQDTHFVVVQTIQSNDDEPPIEFRSLISSKISVEHLEYISQDELPKVLSMLGLKNRFPDDVISALYGICGGHLHVLQQLASYLKASDLSRVEDWATLTEVDFVSTLVKSRLKSMGSHGSDLLDILKTASIIGTIFSDQELACLCDRKPPDIRKLLSAGEGMHLIRRGQQTTYFAHGIVHESLRQSDALQTEDLHRQFSSCLRKLRPGDYRSRIRHLLAAGEKREAAVLAVCALLQDRRSGIISLDDAAMRELVAEGGFSSVTDQLGRAQDLMAVYDFDGALRLLATIDTGIPLHLQAESAYIRSMCLIKAYQYDTRESAVKILQKWIANMSDEGDLVTRMLSTQLVALVHQRREEEARDVEMNINETLSKRLDFDPDAMDALRILERKADLLYSADVSQVKLRRARNHFMPLPGGQPKNLFQYCASTLNLAANRLVSGEYEEALTYLRELASFLETRPGHGFTRFEVLTNNLIVCEFLAGVCDAALATQHFEKLTDHKFNTMDFYLIQSNFGACAAMAGDLSRARGILDPLVKKLKDNPEVDDLHLYLAGTNLASVLFLSGDQLSAKALWDDLSRIRDTAMPPHRAYFRERHEILRQAIESGRVFSVSEWSEIPKRQSPHGAGPCWKHYGRGFLFTDLQIFTES